MKLTPKELPALLFGKYMGFIALGARYAARLCDESDCNDCPYQDPVECETIRALGMFENSVLSDWTTFANAKAGEVEAITDAMEKAASEAYNQTQR
jgi:hypothetical protein